MTTLFFGYLFLITAVVFECLGHIAMSIGSSTSNSTLQAIVSKNVLLGVLCFIIYIILWTYCLNILPVSIAYALSSLQVIVLVFLSAFFLGEKLSRQKIIGSVLIALGTVLIILSTMES